MFAKLGLQWVNALCCSPVPWDPSLAMPYSYWPCCWCVFFWPEAETCIFHIQMPSCYMLGQHNLLKKALLKLAKHLLTKLCSSMDLYPPTYITCPICIYTCQPRSLGSISYGSTVIQSFHGVRSCWKLGVFFVFCFFSEGQFDVTMGEKATWSRWK